MNMKEAWKSIVHEVNRWDKQIESTNPFSSRNYCNKKYTDFFDFYKPEKHCIFVWVDDVADE